jgi:hypothetical protein
VLLAALVAACVSAEPGSGPGGAASAAPSASLRAARGRFAGARPVPSAPHVSGHATSGPLPAAPTGAGDAVGTPIREIYRDAFDRGDLGPDWQPTSPAWRISQGRLCVQGARNHPVWLRRGLPVNARIEFDATGASADGDIKVEVWGDGKSAAEGVSYTNATSYIAILGGWKNRYHVLARLDEHAPDRHQIEVDPRGAEPRARPVEAGRAVHFKVERRDGKTVQWLVDDIELFSFADPEPLAGPGHDALGFNDWEVPVCFDNLVITPLSVP